MNRRISWTLVAAGLVATVTAAVAQSRSSGPSLTHLEHPNSKAMGYAPASRLSTELRQTMVAQGSMALENPQGIIGWYGYENDIPSPDNPAVPQMVPTAATPVEAQKTEPDKNTYLVLKDQKGPDRDYDYGTHFLFQGHELAATVAGEKQGYITRINLDADTAHRVTLMATRDTAGKTIATIDGSTWDPFAKRLLFTTESAANPTYAATATYPSEVEDVSGALGGEQQAFRERVPGRAVDGSDRLARSVTGCHQRHPMRRVGVEVDPRDVPLLFARNRRGKLVALEEEVRAVVIVAVGALLVLQDQVGVLVRLRLLRLDRCRCRRDHLRHCRVVGARDVVLVTVPADDPLRVFERHRALRDHGLAELGREPRRRSVAHGFGIGMLQVRERGS